MELYKAMETRRSHYDITAASPISQARIQEILSHAITYVPSAFHSQTSRAVLLFGARHQKLWSIVKETLRAIVPAENFASTDAKIDSFASGYGTILYLEDMNAVAEMQKAFPLYADNFPIWSNQSSGMLQYAVWTALSSEGLGASLQHYNPLIDAETAKEFGLPEGWRLVAQMPFGKPQAQPDELVHKPIEERLIVQGADQ